MIEFDPAIAKRYTELMAPAFVDGCQKPTTLLDGAEGLSLAGVAMTIRDRLQRVDWEASGLPVKQYGGPEDSLKQRDQAPGRYAERLMEFAFEDAHMIIQVCELFSANNELPPGVTMRDLLLNGREKLLAVGRLQDKDKDDILDQFKYPELANCSRGKDLPMPEQAIVLGRGAKG